ncbi:hypothetical protein SAMN02787142_1253 [Burkholderia sp. WP9]|nr:hypothetical protein SAMN02787142_1253 [Burkholderia sp. WP9]
MKNHVISLLMVGAIGVVALLCTQAGPGTHGPVCGDRAVVWRYW